MKSRKSFTPKTFSQNVARFFEYGCYLLFISGNLAVIYSCIFPLFVIVSVPVFVFGVFLFFGYFKHSRDDLSDGKILLMWIGTFLFNLIPLMLIFYADDVSKEMFQLTNIYNVLWSLLILWWFGSICLSGGALISELRKS